MCNNDYVLKKNTYGIKLTLEKTIDHAKIQNNIYIAIIP